MKRERKIYFSEILIYIAVGLFYLWMAAQIPYTVGDDCKWGLDIGIEWLLTGSINTRYIGNLFVVIMTRSEILKTIIMGVFLFLCPYMVSGIVVRLCNCNSSYFRCGFFILANVLLLSVPRLVWQEACGWISGFANFGISASFMLICFRAWIDVWDDVVKIPLSKVQQAGYVLAAFCGQMFIENLSIVMTLLSILVAIVYHRKNKMHSILYVAMAIACVLGLSVMFSSAIYKPLFETGSAVGGYRNIIIHSNRTMKDIVFSLLFQGAVLAIRFGEANTVLSSAVLICMALFFVFKTKEKQSVKIIISVVHIILISYFVATYATGISYSVNNLGSAMIAAVLSVVYIVAVSIEVLRLIKTNKRLGIRLTAIWTSAILLIAPLLAVDENGSRLFYTVIVIIIIFVLVLVSELIGDKYEKTGLFLFGALKVVLILLLCMYITVYSAIGKCKEQRKNLIDEAKCTNSDNLALPRFPYEEYLYGPDPENDSAKEMFKQFYGIPDYCEIVFE